MPVQMVSNLWYLPVKCNPADIFSWNCFVKPGVLYTSRVISAIMPQVVERYYLYITRIKWL